MPTAHNFILCLAREVNCPFSEYENGDLSCFLLF